MDDLYRGRLCQLVEREMNRRFRRREDPEDVVQSAFRTFYRRSAQGEFRIDTSTDLWRLLETITRHKLLKHVEKLGTAKRNPRREEYPERDDLPGCAPTPAEAAIAADLIENALAGLDASYVSIFNLRLQKHTEEEMAAKLELHPHAGPHQAEPDSRPARTTVRRQGRRVTSRRMSAAEAADPGVTAIGPFPVSVRFFHQTTHESGL